MECTPGTRVLVDVMVDTQVSEPKHHWILLGQVEINLSGSRVAAALGYWCGGGEGVDGAHRGVTHSRPVHRVTPDPSVHHSWGNNVFYLCTQQSIRNSTGAVLSLPTVHVAQGQRQRQASRKSFRELQ